MLGGDAGSEQGAEGVAEGAGGGVEGAGAADNCRAGEPIAALAAAAAAGCIFIFILAGFVADVGGAVRFPSVSTSAGEDVASFSSNTSFSTSSALQPMQVSTLLSVSISSSSSSSSTETELVVSSVTSSMQVSTSSTSAPLGPLPGLTKEFSTKIRIHVGLVTPHVLRSLILLDVVVVVVLVVLVRVPVELPVVACVRLLLLLLFLVLVLEHDLKMKHGSKSPFRRSKIIFINYISAHSFFSLYFDYGSFF